MSNESQTFPIPFGGEATNAVLDLDLAPTKASLEMAAGELKTSVDEAAVTGSEADNS